MGRRVGFMGDSLPTGVVRLLGLVLWVAGRGLQHPRRGVGASAMMPGQDAGPATDGPAPDAWMLPDVPPEPDAGSTDGVPDACIPLTCTARGPAVLRPHRRRLRRRAGVWRLHRRPGAAAGTERANVCPPAPGCLHRRRPAPPAGGGQYCGIDRRRLRRHPGLRRLPSGQTCGAAGIPGVCAVPPASSCTRLT